MQEKIYFYEKISFRIIAMLLLFLALTALILSSVVRNNIRQVFEESFNERVLLTNALMAANVDSDEVKYFVDLIESMDDGFRQRQVRYHHDRHLYWVLHDTGTLGGSEEELLSRLTEFRRETEAMKNDLYWNLVDELRRLKEISKSTYLYIMADTGLISDDGEPLYTIIIDADDTPGLDEPDADGLGTSDVSLSNMREVYETKRQMDWVSYYIGDYGELYYSYAPVIDSNGEVIAIFGTDLDLVSMNNSVRATSLLFNLTFLAFFVVILLFIYIFIRKSIIEPLGGLTKTARELAQGNVYFTAPETDAAKRDEIGTLASAVREMQLTFDEMISSTEKLFKAANVGKLDVRNDSGNFKGDIRNVIDQINDTLDSVTLYLNNIPEGIFIMNKELEIYFRNDKYKEFFGDPPALELISKIFPSDESDDADREAYLKERVTGLLEQGKGSINAWVGEMCFSVYFIEIAISAEEADNSVLVIAVDITDLMNEKENAQAAAKAKSDFLSRMSHEMRTPMNAIIGMAKIAETTDDVSRLRYCLKTIGSSSSHLLGIINDVLDMSKIEAGKLELELVPMNIEKMLMKVCNIVIDKMEEKNHKFNVVLGKNLNLNYIADDLRLSQIIANLLSNAVKFTPDGGRITLAVDKAGQKDNKTTLRFAVTDTGIGMTKEQLGKLFNAFEQADGSVSRKYGGTGLGLAISKNIIEQMDGRIWVETEPGAGSSFIFEVNLERAPRQESVIYDGISPGDTKDLVIESDADILGHFVSITDSFGIKTDSASDTVQALAKVSAAYDSGRPYDIIFLDYEMPETNGIDLVKQLKGRIDNNTVIIITTHQEWYKIEKSAIENNITRCIAKPIFPSSVLDAINEVVGSMLKSLEIKTDNAYAQPDLSGVSVLLAEDVEINREIFITLLEDTKIKIDTAENGKIAVDKFAANPEKYDMIIMDVQMPEMDGFQATRTIRAMDFEKAKKIPILAMTANAFKEDIERCRESGMDDHMPKPINEKNVIEKITYYSKLKR